MHVSKVDMWFLASWFTFLDGSTVLCLFWLSFLSVIHSLPMELILFSPVYSVKWMWTLSLQGLQAVADIGVSNFSITQIWCPPPFIVHHSCGTSKAPSPVWLNKSHPPKSTWAYKSKRSPEHQGVSYRHIPPDELRWAWDPCHHEMPFVFIPAT